MFGSILSVAGPLLGGLLNKKSAGEASKQQTQADTGAIDELRRQSTESREDLTPFREAGGAATMRLRELMGLGSSGPGIPTGDQTNGYQSIYDRILAETDARHREQYGMGLMESPDKEGLKTQLEQIDRYAREEAARAAAAPKPAAAEQEYQIFGESPLLRRFTEEDFRNDPVTKLGLQFGLDEGRKGIDRSAASRGMLHSGSRLKALTKFGTDYTGTKAGESYNRFTGDQQNVYNRLFGLGNMGLGATTASANMGNQNANSIASMLSSGGNARGAAEIAKGNALSSGFTSVGNMFGQNAMLDKVLNARGAAAIGTGGGGNIYSTDYDPYNFMMGRNS